MRWQYDIVEAHDPDGLCEILQSYGRAGWEAFAVVTCAGRLVAVVKQPIGEDDHDGD